MRVISDEKSGTWTFISVESAEEQVLASVISTLKPGDRLGYNGRSTDENGSRKVHLHAGGCQKDIKRGNITHIGVWVGGIDFVLRGSTKSDDLEVRSIRDTCYFGHGWLI